MTHARIAIDSAAHSANAPTLRSVSDQTHDASPLSASTVQSVSQGAIKDPQILMGQVMHRRLSPTKNAFTYPTVFLRLPLSSLASRAGDHSPWFAFDRPGLLSFRCSDHANKAISPAALREWALSTLASQSIDSDVVDGEIVLATYPRLLGYVFNPVSFWMCHDKNGRLRAVIAEVNNTFGESHNYVVAHGDLRPIVSGDRIVASKVFHVSPFLDVKGQYEFSFRSDEQMLHAVVNYYEDGTSEPLTLATSISGRARPLTADSARHALLTTPLMTLGVMARIHYQAFKLFFKRVKFFSKPSPPIQQTTLSTSTNERT
jgi:uncharacterized protein